MEMQRCACRYSLKCPERRAHLQLEMSLSVAHSTDSDEERTLGMFSTRRSTQSPPPPSSDFLYFQFSLLEVSSFPSRVGRLSNSSSAQRYHCHSLCIFLFSLLSRASSILSIVPSQGRVHGHSSPCYAAQPHQYHSFRFSVAAGHQYHQQY